MSCTNEYWEFDYRTTFDSCGGNKHNYIPDLSYNVSLIIQQHLIALAGSPNPPCGPEDHVSGMYIRQVQHQHHHHLHKQHHPHHHHHKGGVNIRAGHASSHLHLHHHTIINISFIIVITLEDHLCGICVSQAANHLATSSDLTRPSQTISDQTRLVIAMACFYVCSLNVFPSQLDDRKS